MCLLPNCLHLPLQQRLGLCRGLGGERGSYLGHQPRPGVDQPGIELNQPGATGNSACRVRSAHDAARRDDREASLQLLGEPLNHESGTRAQRRAAQPARLLAVGQTLDTIAGHGRIGRDHGVYAMREQQLRHIPHLLIAEIGRDLERQGHVAPVLFRQPRLLRLERLSSPSSSSVCCSCRRFLVFGEEILTVR